MRDDRARIRSGLNAYLSIGTIAVPVLGNENVHFTRAGFSHLIRKGGRMRASADMRRRLSLIPLICPVLQDRSARLEHRSQILPSGASLRFWGVTAICNDREITIVITETEGGHKEFLSVLDNR